MTWVIWITALFALGTIAVWLLVQVWFLIGLALYGIGKLAGEGNLPATLAEWWADRLDH